MSTKAKVIDLTGFFKQEDSKYIKPVKKSKSSRNRVNYQKRRESALKYLGLNKHATNTGICLCIHKETGWPMPGQANRNKLYISKFARRIKKKRKAYKAKSAIKGFYDSKQWKELRFAALCLSDGACQLCGGKASDGLQLHVDHIKPRSKFPSLELDIDNLQILCIDCNIGKSNYDDTDFRT